MFGQEHCLELTYEDDSKKIEKCYIVRTRKDTNETLIYIVANDQMCYVKDLD